MRSEVAIAFRNGRSTANQGHNGIPGGTDRHEKSRRHASSRPALFHHMTQEPRQNHHTGSPTETLVRNASDENRHSLMRRLSSSNSRRNGTGKHGVEDQEQPSRRHLNRLERHILEDDCEVYGSRDERQRGVDPETDANGHRQPRAGVSFSEPVHGDDNGGHGEPKGTVEETLRRRDERLDKRLWVAHRLEHQHASKQRKQHQVENKHNLAYRLQPVELLRTKRQHDADASCRLRTSKP